MNTWQLCPKCNGTGQSNQFDGRNFTNYCDLCNGAKIISVLTGLPPKNTTTSNSTTLNK